MTTTLVLTVFGKDRAGIVADIAKVVGEHDANWEASQMTRLGGQFAGILKVSIKKDRVSELSKALQGLGPAGLDVIVNDRIVNTAQGPLFWIELVGSDQPNIVHKITEAFANYKVSVTELTSEIYDAPHGARLFKMQAAIRCPTDLPKNKLSDSLEELANSLMVDIRIND